MLFLQTVLLGLLVGIVVKPVITGRDPAGFLITTSLGVAGSLITTYLARAVGLPVSGGWISAPLGAGLLLVLYYAVSRPGVE